MSKSPAFQRTFFVLLVLFIIAALALPVTPASASKSNALGAWTQQWSDEFSGTGALNTANWIYDIGTSYPGGAANWGTGEIESNTNSTANVYQSGGYLYIKPIRATNGTWTSGRVETQRADFQPPAGGAMAIEGRLQLPNVTGAAAQGYWPAFWALGTPFRGNYWNWPSIGELDIMENVNGQNTWYGTFHCGVNPGGPCNETSGIGANTSGFSPSLQAGFHTYRVEWDKSVSPNQVRWYVDGVQRHSVNSSQFDATTWNNAFNHAYFIILNVAMGGGWPGNPTASTTSGVPMVVDYVRVFYANGSGTNPTATPVPTTAGSGFTSGVTNVSATQARPWFKPSGWTAGYVILHYKINNGAQQNLNMSYDTASAQWRYTISGMAAGQVLSYSYTYQKSGLQYDTAWYSWTKP